MRMTDGSGLREGNKPASQHLKRARKGLVDKLDRTREFPIVSWGVLRHVLSHDHVCLNTRFHLDYPRLTRDPGMDHVETKQGSPKSERREQLYIQFHGYLKAGSVGKRKVGSAGTIHATESI